MSPCVIETRNHAVPDDVALQLCHGADDREHRLAHGRRGVERFPVGDEADYRDPEFRKRGNELLDSTTSN